MEKLNREMKKPTLDLSTLLTLSVLVLAFVADCKMPAATVWLDDLDVRKTIQDWGDPKKINRLTGTS